MKKNKADKKKYVDDGHTIYNMDNVPQAFYRRKSTDKNVGLNRKERRAAIRAALATYLPMFPVRHRTMRSTVLFREIVSY